MFSNKVSWFHTGDLFDIQSVTLDICKHTKNLCPNLVSNFSQPLSNMATSGEGHMDCSEVYYEEQLALLYWLLGKLHCLVDDHIHLQ